MKTVDVQENLKRQHIVDRLHELNYYDTDGKTYKELVHKLAVLQAMEINIGSDENKWF